MPSIPAPPTALAVIAPPTVSIGSAVSRVAVSTSSPANAVFPGSDFVYLDRPKRKACILVHGAGGTGKTTLAVKWCPSPVALIAFDGRSEYAMEISKLAGRPVPYVPIHMPTASDILKMSSAQAMKAAREAVDKVIRNFCIAVDQSAQNNVRTICLDTGTEFDRLLHLAIKGNADEPGKDHGKAKNLINQVWWQMFADVRNVGNAHFVVLARSGESWENNNPTGEYYPKINDVVIDAVDWAGHIRIGRKQTGAVGGLLQAASPVSPVPPGVAVGIETGALPQAPAAPVVVIGGATNGGGGRVSSMFDPTVPVEFQIRITKAGNSYPERGKVYGESDWGSEGPFVYVCTKLMPGSTANDWR